MNCLIIVGPSSTGRRESEVEIRIQTYSDSITSVHRGAERIEDYKNNVYIKHTVLYKCNFPTPVSHIS